MFVTNSMPELDLKVGDIVLQRRGFGIKAWEAQEYVKGTVVAVHRVYATVEFSDVYYRNGRYRRDTGAPEHDRQGGYITTQARVDWRNALEDARKVVGDAGFQSSLWHISDGLTLAMAEFLRGVDADGEPISRS